MQNQTKTCCGARKATRHGNLESALPQSIEHCNNRMTASESLTTAPERQNAEPSVSNSGNPTQRLSWLDALRGLAASLIVMNHIMPYLPGGLFTFFRGGSYCVMLFFLVSGYVIPMSLERYGSLRRFWVGRIFRIYPAWLLAFAAMLAVLALGLGDPQVSRQLDENTLATVLGNVTMLQEFLGVPNIVYVFWTLSYEMTFYLLVSALFVFRLHRRSTWWAVGLAIATLVAGPVLPHDLLTGGRPSREIVVLVTVLVAASVMAYLRGHRSAALVAGIAGLFVVVLPAVNGSPVEESHAAGPWRSLTYLTVMFAGTVIYAAHNDHVRRRTAAATLTAVGACLLAAAWLYTPQPGQPILALDRERAEAVITLMAVAATFGLGHALRHRRVPGAFAWLGRISYSMYLLHPIVIFIIAPYLLAVRHRSFVVDLGIASGYLATVLVTSWLSYLTVERPGQRLGRKLGRLLDRRWGPDWPGSPLIDIRTSGTQPVDQGARDRHHPPVAGVHRGQVWGGPRPRVGEDGQRSPGVKNH